MYTKEIIDEIKLLYSKNLNTVQISRQLGISQTGTERLLKKENLFVKKVTRHKIPESEDLNIIKLYTTDNLNTLEIALIYEVTDKSILGILKKHKINTSDSSKYSKVRNQHAFKEIDTELKAWLLGYIIADGNVYKPNKKNSLVFQFEVQERDIEVLERLCELIEYPKDQIRKIERNNHNPTVKISFHSRELCEDLMRYGVVPRKSPTAYIPEISSELKRHLIRGLLDGDGTITNSTIVLYGNERIVKELSEVWSSIGVNKDSIKFYNTTCHRVAVSQKTQRLKILEYLYKDANYFLSRKAAYSPFCKQLQNEHPGIKLEP